MNGITHKQAQNYLRLDLDGLLTDDQRQDLEAHLSGCEACLVEAQAFSTLTSRLQSGFRSRWDAQDGPSMNVTANVRSQTRRIIMTNRISFGIKALGGAAAVLAFGLLINLVISQMRGYSFTNNLTKTPAASSPVSAMHTDGLLAFTSKQDGNAEIYTIRPDGSGSINLTSNPANDSYPFWSPDGRQIAFISDRDGSSQIYLMDADGSNVSRLTEGEGNYSFDANGFSPWSPDGRKLIISHMLPGEQNRQLYVLDTTDKTLTPLTEQPDEYMLMSWSADGMHIAFIASEVGRSAADLYVVGSDGNGLVKLTETLLPGEYFSRDYEWSVDGNSIFFATHNNNQVLYISTVYRSSVDGVKEIAAQVTDRQIINWWSNGEIRLELAERTMHWTRVDGSESQLELCEKSSDIRGMAFERSHAGNLVFGLDCSPDGWTLYWIPPDATTADPLLDQIIPSQQDSLFGLTFSSNERYLAFVTLDSTSVDLAETLYILNIENAREDPSAQPLKLENSYGQDWQPTVKDQAVDERPIPRPTPVATSETLPEIGTNISNGEWIAFIGGDANSADFKLDVYKIHPDGTGLVNLTNFPAHYYWLEWSPDGKHLLFMRDNPSRKNTDIMRSYADSTGAGVITRPITDPDNYGYSWSPNSDKIVFADASGGNYDIYTMFADGRNDPQMTQLTNNPGKDVGFVWSPDGNQIAFQRLDGNHLSILVMNEDGSNQREVAHGTGKVRLRWLLNGISIYASAVSENDWLECEGCVAKPAIYRIGIEGQSVQQIYYEQDVSTVDGWYLYGTPQNTLYFMRIVQSAFLNFQVTWMQADSASIRELGDIDPGQTCKTTTGNILGEHISPNERFSIISDFCAGGFDLYLADRETSDPEKRLIHLLRLPSPIYGQGGDEAYLPISWSPDGRWLIYDNGNQSLNLLSIEKTMQDPTTKPSVLFHSESNTFLSSEVAWQPVSANRVEEKLTPAPTETISSNRLIAFVSEESGDADIYTMRADGSERVNLTNHSAHDANPFWSPDGGRIAFESDRAGFTQIFVMNVDGSNVFQVTDGEMDHKFEKLNPWSPDGSRLLFTEKPPENDKWLLYRIGVDGQNKTPLADVPSIYSDPSWSPDGQHVAYIVLEPIGNRDMARIHVVDANGDGDTNVTNLLPADEDLYSWQYTWTNEGNIRFVAGRVNWENNNGRFAVYEATIDGATLAELTTTSTPIGDYWDGTTFVSGFTGETLTWLRPNGTYSEYKPFEKCNVGIEPRYGSLYKRSPHGYWFFAAGCPDGNWWFTWANPRGTRVQQLFDYPFSAGQGISNIVWSPDDKYIAINAVSADITYMYVINVVEALKDPSVQPVKIPLASDQQYYNISWQPIP